MSIYTKDNEGQAPALQAKLMERTPSAIERLSITDPTEQYHRECLSLWGYTIHTSRIT